MPKSNGLPPLELQLSLLARLMGRNDAVTLKELLEPSDPDAETVRRHLVRLESQLPGVEGKGPYNTLWRFVWPHQAEVAPTTLLALRIANTLLGTLRGSKLGQAFHKLVNDHDRRTPDATFKAADVSRMFYAKSRMLNPLGVVPDRLDTLADAIFHRKQIRIGYIPFDKPEKVRVVEPYTLVFADEGIYLYAKQESSADGDFHRNLRLFNVVRITSISSTGESFLYPERNLYDPEAEFGDCFGVFVRPDATIPPLKVVVEFAPRWKTYLSAQKWHKSQSAPDVQLDGWCRVTFTLHQTHDLTTWLRGHGNEVRVVEPESLAESIRTGGNPA